MKTWIRFLTIGWSFVSAAIIIVTYNVMKYEFVTEDYIIELTHNSSELKPGDIYDLRKQTIVSYLYNNYNGMPLYKSEFIERIKNVKSINLNSSHSVDNKSIYLYLPLYSFVVWAFPILVFTLLGILFERGRTITPESDMVKNKNI